MAEEYVQKTLRLPVDLARRLEAVAQETEEKRIKGVKEEWPKPQ